MLAPSLWLATSAQAFSPAPDQLLTLPNNLRASEVITGDVDGDGDDDLVVLSYDGVVWTHWLFRGTPAGVSVPATQLPGHGSRARTLDVDGDGDDEIVDLDLTAGAMTVWAGGPGLPGAPMSVTAVNVAGFGGVGDLDGDGRKDLAITDTATPGVGSPHTEIYYGSGAGLAASPDLQLADNPSGLAVTDVDGDGYDDVVRDASGRLQVLLGGPTGLATTATWSRPDRLGSFFQYMVGGGDVDGDGRGDLLVSGSWDVHLFLGSATGLVGGWELPYTNGREATVAFLPDVDGDGDDEVWMGDPDWGAQHQGRAFQVSGGTGAVSAVVRGATWELAGIDVATGDIDGNGVSDTITVDATGAIAVDRRP